MTVHIKSFEHMQKRTAKELLHAFRQSRGTSSRQIILAKTLRKLQFSAIEKLSSYKALGPTDKRVWDMLLKLLVSGEASTDIRLAGLANPKKRKRSDAADEQKKKNEEDLKSTLKC